MGVTTYLTTDLASIPLIWIIPLALYLLSFILAFARSAAGLVRAASWSLPYLVVPLVLVMIAGFVHLLWIPLHLLAFFAGSLACHGALAELRPPARNLSAFYVTIALGGLLGGTWNALVAPLLFNRVVEYPLALVLACLAAPGFKTRDDRQSGKDRLWDLLFAGVVFMSDGDSGDQPGRAGRLRTGRAGRDGRLGDGNSVLRDGPAQADPVCARGRRGDGGRRSVAGRERPLAPHRA